MKKIGFIYLCALLFSFAFVSCDNGENVDEDLNVYSYSEISDLDISLLDIQDYVTGYFTIEASGNWTVSSTQMAWVKFSKSVDGEFFEDVTGGKGVDTVYVRISNDARGFDVTSADIKLFAGGEEYIVASVQRPGKEWLTITDKNGDVVKALEIGNNATEWFAINAPFVVGIVEKPEWILEPVFENDGYRLTVGSTDEALMNEVLQNPLEGTLLISDETMTYQCSVPVKYSGMDSTIVEISGDSPWNWLASIDGKELKSKQATDSVVIKNSLEMNVVCRNNAYTIVFAEEVDSMLYPKSADEAWIGAVRDASNPRKVTVTVDASESPSPRSGYLFAVPDALYDSFNTALALNDSTTVFLNEYERYVLAQVEQRDSGFDVYLLEDETETRISCEIDETADYYIYVATNYFCGTAPDVSACNVEYGKEYIINTKLTATDWKPKNFDLFALYDIKGEIKIQKSKWVPELEGVLGEDGYYKILVTIPNASWFEKNNCDSTVGIRLHTSEMVNLKALVFKVQ